MRVPRLLTRPLLAIAIAAGALIVPLLFASAPAGASVPPSTHCEQIPGDCHGELIGYDGVEKAYAFGCTTVSGGEMTVTLRLVTDNYSSGFYGSDLIEYNAYKPVVTAVTSNRRGVGGGISVKVSMTMPASLSTYFTLHLTDVTGARVSMTGAATSARNPDPDYHYPLAVGLPIC